MNNYTIDAKNQKLGRLASKIAHLLQGKNSVNYNPRILVENKVTISNIKGLVMSGKKMGQKKYYKHSGPLGHLKEKKLADVFVKNPAWVLRHAVNLMLPKNRLRAKRMNNLIISQ